MGAVSAAATSVDKSLGALLSGGRLPKGAKVRTFTVTLPASYDAGGSALDMSAIFKDRVFFAAPMSPFAINATTGALFVGLVPGTAKTDGQGGFSPSDWKVRCAATATETTAATNLGAYTFTMFAVGQ